MLLLASFDLQFALPPKNYDQIIKKIQVQVFNHNVFSSPTISIPNLGDIVISTQSNGGVRNNC
jgi:hypothetical protein